MSLTYKYFVVYYMYQLQLHNMLKRVSKNL